MQEGPTPRIGAHHAAQVAAGVYLVARYYGFYCKRSKRSKSWLDRRHHRIFAATIAVASRDGKKSGLLDDLPARTHVLAWRRGYSAETLHLTTPAASPPKALLSAERFDHQPRIPRHVEKGSLSKNSQRLDLPHGHAGLGVLWEFRYSLKKGFWVGLLLPHICCM